MKDLDTLLREDASRPLPDAGFTARVLGALPAPRRAPAWMRPALVLGSAVTGSALAAMLAPRTESFSLGIAEFLSSGMVTPATLTALAIGGTLLLSALVLAFDSDGA